ncbi:TetR/AcrR family transcriptional regulator [Sphingopyxis sp.]|uniref:TetR/AcrR family transcriptional regulator n=1 Tax=Sphingopyxis sp. TaxID=1908224 RepID=UPI0035B343C9
MLPDINIPIKERIIDSAINVIATVGMHRTTHRKIAQAAGISLSSTTYYYETKEDIFRDAVSRVLYTYLGLFQQTVEAARFDAASVDPIALIIELISNAAERDRDLDHAWAEIILASARTDEGQDLALAWFSDMDDAWIDLAEIGGLNSDATAIQCLLDVTCGLVFMTLSLGLDRSQVLSVIQGADPIETWHLAAAPRRPAPEQKGRRNGAQTREKLIDTAVDLLLEGGTGALTYQAVAERGGVALTAPSYHFGRLSNLLNAAEARLFEWSKLRYREGLALHGARIASRSALIDTTTAILIREATEYSAATIAHYSIWSEAARDTLLRPMVAEAILDQTQAWQKQLSRMTPTNINVALACEAFFIGWLIRATSTGAPLDMLATARSRFDLVFETLTKSGTIEAFFRTLLQKSK